MNRIIPVVLAVVLSASSVNVAHADLPGADWMPIQQVLEKVLKSGFTLVSKIEADDGRWEGEGIKDGKRVKFYADPKTGEIMSTRPER
ncbi:PepSY domain-containing protein [Bradyrhizobium liaoningense]|uniref:PepSY domain-containing protein n=1 Tax=Bradyrhizobium liaoningense TaxID=43992 RepID=UPI001BADCE3B|nr:PepSY domain-containing protein [Bradyrhizobium liaoningense]MBR0844078.1 PepSY domain-containing protein [Bradyrhizobium liaoningense]MBR0856451.1 PepSY domain-containing protein [Bradyrhizobium liaoningense]